MFVTGSAHEADRANQEGSSSEGPSVILIRLKKESPKKCSLTPIRQRQDLEFRWVHCSIGDAIEVGEVTLLHPEGPPLTSADACRPLLLVDSSWRDLPRVLRTVSGTLHRRSLPDSLQTAYPRKSNWFADPGNGLASIEALYAALVFLGHRDESLLDGFRWRNEFKRLNKDILPS